MPMRQHCLNLAREGIVDVHPSVRAPRVDVLLARRFARGEVAAD
eukprot:CAMPEP_0180164832 /NCGR_PEP_ID=MMETSP0986-20121125/30607_1 /TAXON_ID=697907 /ORGANISM="non described non described, Strain CCMP2293" /LENGTH=43 /DNA_ID= /DNA_START= /DNA_END= /DNA_ORIENTATION=